MGTRTRQLLLEARPLIERVSGDRVRHEIDNILAENQVTQMLDRTQELGILKEIHPNLIWDDWTRARISNLEVAPSEWKLPPCLKGIPLKRILSYTLWLMRLPAVRAREVTKRLRVSSIIAETVQDACQLWAKLPSLKNAKPSEFVNLFNKSSTAALYSVYCATVDEDLISNLQTYISEWRFVSPNTTGYDLQTRGLPPGPHFKKILTELRNAWLDGEITSAEDEEAMLEKLIEGMSNLM